MVYSYFFCESSGLKITKADRGCKGTLLNKVGSVAVIRLATASFISGVLVGYGFAFTLFSFGKRTTLVSILSIPNFLMKTHLESCITHEVSLRFFPEDFMLSDNLC